VVIKGGYYLKARCIQNSEIATMPPHIREIWDWLLKEANHTSNKVNGTVIERGQLIKTFKDIQEGLYWMVGWRKMKYKKWQCENAMKFLRERSMITTMKTTRGMLITICNYSHYQDPKNYESNRKADMRATVNKQTTDTINKNDKNDKNGKKVLSIYDFWNLQDIVTHKSIDPFISSIKIALKKYSEEAIKTAIKNYSYIIKSDDYFYNFRFTLIKFLTITAKTNHIEEFSDLEIAKNNYTKGDYNGKNKQNIRGFTKPGEDKYKHLEETYEV